MFRAAEQLRLKAVADEQLSVPKPSGRVSSASCRLAARERGKLALCTHMFCFLISPARSALDDRLAGSASRPACLWSGDGATASLRQIGSLPSSLAFASMHDITICRGG